MRSETSLHVENLPAQLSDRSRITVAECSSKREAPDLNVLVAGVIGEFQIIVRGHDLELEPALLQRANQADAKLLRASDVRPEKFRPHQDARHRGHA